MKREIKFRAKTLHDYTWRYGYSLKAYDDMCMISSRDSFAMCHQSTIGQYIGLKDKNGKEIYEGDIVEWLFWNYERGAEIETYVKGIIEWYQGGFILKIVNNDFEEARYYGISSLNTDTESDVEVLGNIYDNRDLLK